MIVFDDDDLPLAPSSGWLEMVAYSQESEAYPQLAFYRANQKELNRARRLNRTSRAKEPAPRTYAGVPVVVRRSVRAHVLELQRAQRAARKGNR